MNFKTTLKQSKSEWNFKGGPNKVPDTPYIPQRWGGGGGGTQAFL